MKYIKNINNLGLDDVKLAGGKGASLGELNKLEVYVPQGYVVLTNAFDDYFEETGLVSEIDTILSVTTLKNIDNLNDASERIRETILSKEIPNEIKKEILSAFNKLGTRVVAVRSSATSEDSDYASWAGQLNTYLNTPQGKLLERIKECWASLFSSRALLYRLEKKLNKEEISMAVVIQKMINSEKSGIAF